MTFASLSSHVSDRPGCGTAQPVLLMRSAAVVQLLSGLDVCTTASKALASAQNSSRHAVALLEPPVGAFCLLWSGGSSIWFRHCCVPFGSEWRNRTDITSCPIFIVCLKKLDAFIARLAERGVMQNHTSAKQSSEI